ncbi:MAG: hypothetical protein P8012_02610 [Desulfobacterales bacterium]
MKQQKGKKFSDKHGIDAKPDKAIKDEILKCTKDEKLPCAVAFEIAKALRILPYEVGKTADLMNFKLTKCQLGLFGYQPQNGRLSCKHAWEIAARFNIRKMAVSSACETMGIKIKECQLGAF